MLDDHSEVDPRLSIPNRTVKRFSADDSAQLPGVKVGHRQAIISKESLLVQTKGDFFMGLKQHQGINAPQDESVKEDTHMLQNT